MKLLLAGILFLAFLKTGLALKCYECYSIKECDENPSQCTTAKEFCWKAEATVFGKKVVTKGCGEPIGAKPGRHEIGCGQLLITGIVSNTCWCRTNFCNGADVQMLSQYVTFTLSFLAILIQFI